MNTRANWLAIVGCLALAAGCSKDKSSSSGGGSAASKAVSSEAMSWFPKEVSLVGGVNTQALFKSAAYKDSLRSEASSSFKDAMDCGIDVEKVLKSLTFGMAGQNVIVLQTGVTKAMAESCHKKNNDGAAPESDGKVTTYKLKGETMYAHWISDDKALLGNNSRALLDKAIAKSSSVNDNPKVGTLLKDAKTGATVWAAGEIPTAKLGMAAMLIGAPKGLLFNADISSSIKLRAALRYADADAAKKVADKANQQLKGMGAMLPIKIPTFEVSGTDVVVDYKLDKADLAKLKGMAQR